MLFVCRTSPLDLQQTELRTRLIKWFMFAKNRVQKLHFVIFDRSSFVLSSTYFPKKSEMFCSQWSRYPPPCRVELDTSSSFRFISEPNTRAELRQTGSRVQSLAGTADSSSETGCKVDVCGHARTRTHVPELPKLPVSAETAAPLPS